MFQVMEAVFPIMFLLVAGMVVVTLVRGIGQWNKNNNSPVLTVDAEVAAKRTEVTHHHSTNASGSNMDHTSTWYYATFQVESGDRMEFSVSGREYGMLAEGDRGRLTFQGTRYKDFARQI